MPLLNEIVWIKLVSSIDSRGVLTSIESGRDIPFEIQRIFYMHHIISDRGGHAHRDTDQVVIAMSGSFKIELYDGLKSIEFKMDDPAVGLFVPRMIYINLFNFSSGAVCLVLANTHYDMNRSIRTIEEYNCLIKSKI
jgi:dTDP-4-dehydrorhamnose 3,5-epimerase-like enzyme